MQEENNQKQNSEKIIRTYTSDMARVIKEKEASVIKIAVAQKEKDGGGIVSVENKIENPNKKDWSKILFIIGGIIFIGLAIFTYYYLSLKKKEIENPVVVNTDPKTPISYESKSYFTTSSQTTISDISNFIKNEKGLVEKERSIKSIFWNKINGETNETSYISTLEFLSIIKTSAPGALIRSLEESFMTGIYYPLGAKTGEGVNKSHLFMIFKTKDYNLAYASMLSWEKTLLDDMKNIFELETLDKSVFQNNWKDSIVNNKDVRVVYDKDGKGVLYYLFLDKSLFVISDDVETIKEIIVRFQIK